MKGSPIVLDERNGNTIDPCQLHGKIIIYQRQVEGWFLEPAEYLLNKCTRKLALWYYRFVYHILKQFNSIKKVVQVQIIVKTSFCAHFRMFSHHPRWRMNLLIYYIEKVEMGYFTMA